MAQNNQPQARPANIFEVINQNIGVLSEDIHSLMDQVRELRAMFNAPAPEKPTAPGDEGAATESKEQK